MNTSSKSGEIALTLTIISLGMMLIGTMFGRVGLQKKPISNKSQAAGSCFYHAVAYVDKVVDGKRSRLTKNDYLNQSLTITNNLGYPSNMFDTPANPQSGQVEAVYEYPKNGIGAGSFKFGKRPTGYEDGDPAHVTLDLNNKWRVTQSECIPLLNSVDGSPDKGCNGNTIKLTNSNTISNFLVTCGVSMKYGWVVEPVNTSGEPTPSPKLTAVPTTQAGFPAQCPYVATAQVLLANQTPLLLSENSGSANFGISNDKQSQTIAAGKFGDSYQYGIKTSNAVKYAQYQYASDNEQFKPENPNALYMHEAKPNGANVTLLGIGSSWNVTGTFCKPGLGARYGDKGCPATKDQGPDATIFKGFKPDCGVNIQYGWYVEKAPTPTRSPTIPPVGPSVGIPPRLPILPSSVPTVPAACSNNLGIITGKIHASTTRTLISANSAQPNYGGSSITILACKIGANNVDCAKPYDQKTIKLPSVPVTETDYSLTIPEISLNQNVAIVYRIPQEVSKHVTVQSTNCKASGIDETGTQGCLVQFIPSASCTSAGPDYNVSLAIPNGLGGHIDIPVTEDAWIQSESRNKNNGDVVVFSAGISFDTGGPVNRYDFFRSLLKFDLSSIKGAIIKKATLNMRQASCGPGIKVISAYKNKSQWHENSVTWNNAPDFFNAKVGSDIIADTCNQIDESGNFGNPDFSSDLQTDVVQQWSDNPNTNFGITIKTPENNTSLHVSSVEDFFSKESVSSPILVGRNPGSVKAPYLSIDYENVHPARPVNKSNTPKAPAKTPHARGDLNGDEVVNVVDFLLTIKKLGTKGVNMPEDFNNDGVVNTVDVASVIANFGKSEN